MEKILMKVLPRWRAGFAYGSGVFSQGHNDTRMLDVLVIVDDPFDWHCRNLRENPSHYFFPAIGPRAIAAFGALGPGVYFNTAVPLSDRRWTSLKYGVASTETLLNDLQTWDHLYLAGRLHKPVISLASDAVIDAALKANRQAAVAAALLALPTTFTSLDLYTTIAGLSYHGDIRFTFGGEDPNKISNIVHHNLSAFHDLYADTLTNAFPLLSSSSSSSSDEGDLILNQEALDPAAVRRHLPPAFQSDPLPRIRRVVRRSSAIQSLKGILTAGPAKASAYVAAKFHKASRRPSFSLRWGPLYFRNIFVPENHPLFRIDSL